MRRLLALAASLLCVAAFGSDGGLGPVPTNVALLAPGPIGSTTPSTGAFTTLSATGAITSTLATGSAPFVVASTTNVPNLNASTLSGKTHADPGPIGSGTPSTGAFTSLTDTGLTINRIPFASTGGLLADSAALSWNGSTLAAGGTVSGTAGSFITSGGGSVLVVGANASGGFSQFRMFGGASKYNFQIDAQAIANNTLCVTPSTATEGTTFSSPSIAIAGATGDVLVGTTTDDAANKLQVAGNLSLTTAGNGFKVKEGSNARMGNSTLSSGTVVVSNTSVTASTRFFLTPHGSTIAAVGISSITAGTSFTIKSSSGSDANTVDWVMLEPAP